MTLATSEALAVGKAVLLAYAITSDTRPGELPCPDVNYDGEALVGDDYSAATGNPCTQLLGWLPHVTLSTSVIEDGSGARLWYALSDDYHEGGTGVLNSEVSGQLDLVDGGGSVVADDIVAVIHRAGRCRRRHAVLSPRRGRFARRDRFQHGRRLSRRRERGH